MREIDWRPGSGRIALYSDAELALVKEINESDVSAAERLNQVDRIHDLKFELDAELVVPVVEEEEQGEQLCLTDPLSATRKQALARTTDPWTSREAAESLSRDRLRETQAAVLHAFRIMGPMHHEWLITAYARHRKDEGWPEQSQSGLRTRTKELVDGGLLEDTGRVVILGSGRASKIWQLCQ